MSPREQSYVYRWDRHGRKGRVCKVTARGTLNSCCVQFGDGFRMVTSRNAIKRAVCVGCSATDAPHDTTSGPMCSDCLAACMDMRGNCL